MASKFRNSNTDVASTTKSSGASSDLSKFKQFSMDDSCGITERGDVNDIVLPKLTSAQLNKLAKLYPSWLKDGSSLKRLPGVYQGVLGQVQLQPNFTEAFNNGSTNNGQKLQSSFNVLKQQQQLDYMNRFTDTERVHQLLSASLLSNDTLATIWAHVNKTFPGKLTNREVCLALALIAIFQRIEKSSTPNSIGAKKPDLDKDPFILVKAEKKPPVPILYPNHNQRGINGKTINTNDAQQSFTKSTNTLSCTKNISNEILVDLWGNSGDEETSKGQNVTPKQQKLSFSKSEQCLTKRPLCFNTSLIDSDCDKFEFEFFTLKQTWLSFLVAMKSIFKRTFDILNVENSRQSAIEALKSSRGHEFSKQLCLCYPLAHNIKYKIEELNSLRISGRQLSRNKSNKTIESRNNPNDELPPGLFDKNYIEQIDDLMTSVNEYWAVLINLFHESGRTTFIELIMDGLNYNQQTVFSETVDELINELNSSGKSNVCSICHTKFYLVPNISDESASSLKNLPIEDADLIAADNNEMITMDKVHYYHAKCANFWLNQVDKHNLPFHAQSQDDVHILSPSK